MTTRGIVDPADADALASLPRTPSGELDTSHPSIGKHFEDLLDEVHSQFTRDAAPTEAEIQEIIAAEQRIFHAIQTEVNTRLVTAGIWIRHIRADEDHYHLTLSDRDRRHYEVRYPLDDLINAGEEDAIRRMIDQITRLAIEARNTYFRRAGFKIPG